MSYVTPLDHRYIRRIINNFGELIGHDAGLVQAVKIKVSNCKFWRVIFAANRECRARYFVGTARAPHEAPGKRCFATTKIADEFNHFTATKSSPELFGELLGCRGTGRFGLPGHVGTHIYHMLPREWPRLQAPQHEYEPPADSGLHY